MVVTFIDESKRIAEKVQEIVQNPALRPMIVPPELLQAALAYPQSGGKALRPALLTLACRALGGSEAAAIRAGTAVELYHTYTLVHDDIIDRDLIRRGKPSVHALMSKVGKEEFGLDNNEASHYGLSMAILTGDVQQAWSISLLSSLPELGTDPEVALQLIHRMQCITGPAIVEGEALDIQLPFLPVEQVTAEMIFRVILAKTASLFSYCAWAGGMLARGREDEDVRLISSFAECAGISFQLQDDLLGLIGDEAKLGKAVGNDLREGKRTMIIANAWRKAGEGERAQLSSVLGNPNATPEAIADATSMLQRLGAINEVQAMADSYLMQALQHLDNLTPNSDVSLLREMAMTMVKREK